jgi:hypothetical protein
MEQVSARKRRQTSVSALVLISRFFSLSRFPAYLVVNIRDVHDVQNVKAKVILQNTTNNVEGDVRTTEMGQDSSTVSG